MTADATISNNSTPAPVRDADLKIMNDPHVAQLHRMLTDDANRPNVLTAAQFIRCLPAISGVERDTFLAAHPGAQGQELLDQLIAEFCTLTSRIYSPTVVVASPTDSTVILEFPPRLTPVQTIKPSVEATIAAAVHINATQNDPNSVHAERSLHQLMNHFNTAQMDPDHIRRIALARQKSESIVRRMAEARGMPDPMAESASTSQSASVMDDADFDF